MNRSEKNLPPIPINDPKEAFEELRRETERAVLEVLASGQYILGPQVGAFEKEIGAYLGVAHAVGVSSGTEALLLALQEIEIGPGDEVVVPAFTFIASATVVARLGARPIFADIDPHTYQMHPARLAAAITPRTRAIIAVHLYGYPAPLDEYARLAAAAKRPMPLVEDAAQAIGTRLPQGAGRGPAAAGAVGVWGCFSFYPTKNLPACGEAGLMVTADERRAGRARQLRTHGQTALYEHSLLGGNARLDALQAAILRVRLNHLETWNDRRRAGAALYDRLFAASGLLSRRAEVRLPPHPPAGGIANYHQYTLRVPDRDALRAHLLERGIHTGIYYPTPVPFQPVFAHLKHRQGEFPEAERAAREVLSLPIHQNLPAGAVERVVGAVVDFSKR